MSPARGSAAPWARRWSPVLAWGTAILVLTSWPNPEPIVDLSLSDEFAHFCVYAVLGFLTGRAMLEPRSGVRQLLALLAIGVFGALDEIHQIWIPNRLATVADWIADVLGASVGLLLMHFRRASLTPRTDPST